MRWWFGSGLAYKMAEPAIRKAMREAGTYVALDTQAERGDKVSRSQSFAARHENHMVRWNKAAPWFAIAESEMLRFPAGRTDDICDTMSLIGLTIDKLSRGRDPAPPPPPEVIFTTSNAPLPEGQIRATWRDVVESHKKHKKRERRYQ